jgi:hypothetical protein
MKRIIDGVTYNTQSVIKVATATDDEMTLYQNCAGVFFVVAEIDTPYRDQGGKWQSALARSGRWLATPRKLVRGASVMASSSCVISLMVWRCRRKLLLAKNCRRYHGCARPQDSHL